MKKILFITFLGMIFILIILAYHIFKNDSSEAPCPSGQKRILVGGEGWTCYDENARIVPMK